MKHAITLYKKSKSRLPNNNYTPNITFPNQKFIVNIKQHQTKHTQTIQVLVAIPSLPRPYICQSHATKEQNLIKKHLLEMEKKESGRKKTKKATLILLVPGILQNLTTVLKKALINLRIHSERASLHTLLLLPHHTLLLSNPAHQTLER